MSGKAKFRLFLLLMLVGIFGYVGFLVYRERDPMPPLLDAERYHKEGGKLEEANDFKEAANKYDLAAIRADQADKRMAGTAHGIVEEAKAKEVKGRILLIKAQALRDKYYALARNRGETLPETPDSVTGKSFRNILMIPDAKARDEAAASLRGAAFYFLPKNYDVQLDALRLSVMTTPYQWDQIEKYSANILALKENDSRAKFMLAKYYYEQPPAKTSSDAPAKPAADKGPADPSKAPGEPYKSLDLMRNARTLIEEVRLDQSFPVWRTDHLRAQIHYWFTRQQKEKLEYRKELEALVQMLIEDPLGPMSRIQRNRDMERLSTWDVDGVLNLQTLAAEIALEEIRKYKPHDVGSLTQVYEISLKFCGDRAKKNDPDFPRAKLIATMLGTMNRCQTVLAMHKPKEWNDGIEMLRPMLDEEFEAKRCEPFRVAQFAELLMREAQLRRTDTKRADDLRAEARKWLDRGLEFGKANNYDRLQLMPFNLLAANIVYLNSSKRQDVQKFLQALQETNHPLARATALVIDGAYDEREGRLEKAHDKMEDALKVRGGDEDVRAHATLVNINMAMGRPDKALVSLTKLQHIYDRYEELSTIEKEWLAQFLRSPQDYYALVVVANLDNARRTIEAYKAQNPTKPGFPPDLVKEEERRVREYLKQRLPMQLNPGYMARIAWIDYLANTGRRIAAQEAWRELNENYFNSDRIELLTSKVLLLRAEAAESRDPAKIRDLPRVVDKEIEEFVKRTNSLTARLFHSLWYAQTGRIDEAREGLKKIQSAEGGTPEFRKLVSTILVSLNTGLLPQSVWNVMPRDPRIDSNLIDMVSLTKIPDAQTILLRHDFGAISRVMEADKDFANGDYAAAAEKFANALDFTRVKTFAQTGLLRSMYALASTKPDVALDLNEQMIHAYPKEPVVFLCYAYVCLCRDNIGEPFDHWDAKRTMGSALDRWDIHMRNINPNPPVALMSLVKADFWFLANRLDFALVEANRARKKEMDSPVALGTCISIIAADPAQEPRTDDLNDLTKELKRVSPELQASLRLVARAEEHLFSARPGGNPTRAIEAYETLLTKFPKDHDGYVRLIDVLDRSGRPADYDRANKWIATWQNQLPDDPAAAAAKIRVLCRASNLAAAREVAGKFMQASLVRGAERAADVKEKDPKVQAEKRDKLLEDIRWANERELARGFFRGGAWAEAESRLKAFPAEPANAPETLSLLGEVYLRQKQWDNAEKVYRQLVAQNRVNYAAVQNLAQVLSKNLKRPEEARDVIRKAIKTESNPPVLRPGERFPPSFLGTVGGVYFEIVNDNPDLRSERRLALGKEMMDFFKSAEKRYPNHAGVALWVGYAYELTGEFVRARDMYDKAINMADKLHEAERVAVLTQAQRLQSELDQRFRQPGPGN